MARSVAVRPALMLVHGAWHGSWAWDSVKNSLRDEGWDTHVVDLPSAAEQVPPTGMYDDAQVIREALSAIAAPVVLVGHSYGAIPATEAAVAAGNVAHLIYLAAFQIDVGDNVWTGKDVPRPPIPATENIGVLEGSLEEFYNDLPTALGQEAVRRLRPQSMRSFDEKLTSAAWKDIPSTYIVCDLDQSIPPSRQEFLAKRAGTVHHLAAGHSSFLSMPDEVAALISETAHKVAPGL